MVKFWLGILCASWMWAQPVVKSVCASGCDYSSLQTAINAAARGWILELKAGEHFDTASGFTLPSKAGTGWITLRSSRLSELPADRRVGPDGASMMPALRVTAGGGNPVIKTTGAPSSYWRLEGLEITLSTANLKNTSSLVTLGDSSNETSPEKISHHFVIDRCYIHGLADDSGPWRAVMHNADYVTITNSCLSEVKLLASVAESQVLVGWSFNGPLTVRNNYLGGGSINTLVGGAGTAVSGITPMNLTYLGNLFEKPARHQIVRYAAAPEGTTLPTTGTLGGGGPVSAQTFWKTDTSELYGYHGGAWVLIPGAGATDVCLDGAFWRDESATRSYWECAGGNWQPRAGGDRAVTGIDGAQWNGWGLKNIFELKHVLGGRLEGNLMQNSFFPTFGQQIGATILLNWVEDQDGPWSGVRNVRVVNNKFRRVATGLVQGSIVRRGTITGAVAGNPTQLSCTSDCSQGGAATRWVRISGATGEWAGINGDWVATFTSSSVFTIPYNSTGRGALASSAKVDDRRVAMTHTNPGNVVYENNLWESLATPSSLTMSALVSNGGTYGYSYGMGRIGLLGFPSTTFRHNTAIKPFVGATWKMGPWVVASGSDTPNMVLSDNLIEAGDIAIQGYYSESGCDLGLPPYWQSSTWNLTKNVVVQAGQWYMGYGTGVYDQYCPGWGWPWKRSGAGVRSSVSGATVAVDATNCGAQNKLTIHFGGGHGMFPSMLFKVTAATPNDIVGSYATPQYRLGTTNLVSQTDTAIEVCAIAPIGEYTGVSMEASADFTDYANKNFRLASTSQYKKWASDGSDPGANQDMVEWATEYSESGQYNPYLDFGVRQFIPSSVGGEFRWVAYSNEACAWTIWPTRTFSSSVGSVSQNRAGRYGVAMVTGLSSNTAYWYKVTCDGGRYRDGTFVTGP